MISFQPTEEQVLAQHAFETLARDIVAPRAAAIDAAADMPDEMLERIWESGAIQMLLDPEGGGPRSRVLSCIVLEAMGWADPSVAIAAGATMAYVQAVMDHGSARQKAQATQDFGGADYRAAAVLIHEPGFDGQVGAFRTIAERTPTGYLLNGLKGFAPLGGRCRDFIVVAACDGKVAAFLVAADTPGVIVESGKGTLGLKGLALADVRFSDVILTADARLGEADEDAVRGLIASARTAVGAVLTGLSKAVFEHITDYTKTRVAHGSALAKKQSVAFRLADMAIDIPSMRWMCWRAASAMEKGHDAVRHARLAHLHCAERAVWIADEGVQLMGGHGYIRDNPAERRYRDARTLSLLEGVAGV